MADLAPLEGISEMTPKLRYTTPPSMTYHVQTWCDGPKCDMQEIEHDGDGWTCPICGTGWVDPEGEGIDALEAWGDELDELPVYDEEGNEINMNNQQRATEIILGRTAPDAAQELHDAGLLMPDLPDVESDGSVVEGGGIGAMYPRTGSALPHVVIFGNPQITPHTQAASDNDDIVAIHVDQLDYMIASLVTARSLMYQEEL